MRNFLLSEPELFANQGAVEATWRQYRGRRLGPYFRVVYRRDGRKRFLYLGADEELARRVRGLLDELHAPARQRRQHRKLVAKVRRSLRAEKKELAKMLALWGVQVKGYEFRGAARAFRRTS